MSAQEPTTGPWQTKSDFDRDDQLTIIANVDGEYVDGVAHCTYDVIARCVDEFEEALPNAVANARFIASAPERIKALESEIARWKAMFNEAQIQIAQLQAQMRKAS